MLLHREARFVIVSEQVKRAESATFSCVVGCATGACGTASGKEKKRDMTWTNGLP